MPQSPLTGKNMSHKDLIYNVSQYKNKISNNVLPILCFISLSLANEIFTVNNYEKKLIQNVFCIRMYMYVCIHSTLTLSISRL